MADPVSLDEAKLFLRVSHTAEDTLIATFIAAAVTRIADLTGLVLDDASPAPLRLCLLYLVAEAYSGRGEVAVDSDALETWLAPYRVVHL
ncbi:head-tail connector protein [Asticcacaulis sp. EMRT-3]|uniref:head-tail connector protein n=1 Tax=Asticcacaulis sp. EMRT-3 TaxID=3040349 RepID=UPI0024AEA1A7|nr:head-tail connector protein [Asticcacaulis sp. EMRT-3]MDI7775385.1 head-tail connector protein [Asticcacaulis sp. EMRT-3]